jgi:hypothetical protein
MTIKVALATSTPTSMTVVATRTSISPASEGGHHRRLFIAAQTAMHETDAQIGKFGTERCTGFQRRLQLQLRRFLDQRTDPVSLASAGNDRAHRGDDLLPASCRKTFAS